MRTIMLILAWLSWSPGYVSAQGIKDVLAAKQCLIEAAEKLPKLPDIKIVQATLSSTAKDREEVIAYLMAHRSSPGRWAETLFYHGLLSFEAQQQVRPLDASGMTAAASLIINSHVKANPPAETAMAEIAFRAGALEGVYRAGCAVGKGQVLVLPMGLVR